MPIPADQRRSYLARQVGTLELSRVGHPNPMALVQLQQLPHPSGSNRRA